MAKEARELAQQLAALTLRAGLSLQQSQGTQDVARTIATCSQKLQDLGIQQVKPEEEFPLIGLTQVRSNLDNLRPPYISQSTIDSLKIIIAHNLDRDIRPATLSRLHRTKMNFDLDEALKILDFQLSHPTMGRVEIAKHVSTVEKPLSETQIRDRLRYAEYFLTFQLQSLPSFPNDYLFEGQVKGSPRGGDYRHGSNHTAKNLAAKTASPDPTFRARVQGAPRGGGGEHPWGRDVNRRTSEVMPNSNSATSHAEMVAQPTRPVPTINTPREDTSYLSRPNDNIEYFSFQCASTAIPSEAFQRIATLPNGILVAIHSIKGDTIDHQTSQLFWAPDQPSLEKMLDTELDTEKVDPREGNYIREHFTTDTSLFRGEPSRGREVIMLTSSPENPVRFSPEGAFITVVKNGRIIVYSNGPALEAAVSAALAREQGKQPTIETISLARKQLQIINSTSTAM